MKEQDEDLKAPVYVDRDVLIKSLKELFSKNGNTLTLHKHSDQRRVIFKCARGGQYVNKLELTEETRRRRRSSRLLNCPFRMEYHYSKKSHSWSLHQLLNEHNHDVTDNLAGISAARRLTARETDVAKMMIEKGSKSDCILNHLKSNMENDASVALNMPASPRTKLINAITRKLYEANSDEVSFMLPKFQEIMDGSELMFNPPQHKNKGRPKGSKNKHTKATKRHASLFEVQTTGQRRSKCKQPGHNSPSCKASSSGCFLDNVDHPSELDVSISSDLKDPSEKMQSKRKKLCKEAGSSKPTAKGTGLAGSLV